MPRGLASGAADRTENAGFTLIETLVALFVATLIFLAIAELITFGLYVHVGAEDITLTAALAGEKMEQLRGRNYAALVPGGSVNFDAGGYFENLDLDSNGTNDYLRRWEITDLGGRKQIRVRVIASLSTIGGAKQTTFVFQVAEK